MHTRFLVYVSELLRTWKAHEQKRARNFSSLAEIGALLVLSRKLNLLYYLNLMVLGYCLLPLHTLLFSLTQILQSFRSRFQPCSVMVFLKNPCLVLRSAYHNDLPDDVICNIDIFADGITLYSILSTPFNFLRPPPRMNLWQITTTTPFYSFHTLLAH